MGSYHSSENFYILSFSFSAVQLCVEFCLLLGPLPLLSSIFMFFSIGSVLILFLFSRSFMYHQWWGYLLLLLRHIIWTISTESLFLWTSQADIFCTNTIKTRVGDLNWTNQVQIHSWNFQYISSCSGVRNSKEVPPKSLG